jgi:hypothetical protein
MVKSALRTPFCGYRLKASWTTLPAGGRGGHCAAAPKNDNPDTITPSEHLERKPISLLKALPKNSTTEVQTIIPTVQKDRGGKLPIDNNPGLFASSTGEFGASVSVHFPALEPTFTTAM